MVLLGHNELNSLQPDNAYTMYVSLNWIIELNDHNYHLLNTKLLFKPVLLYQEFQFKNIDNRIFHSCPLSVMVLIAVAMCKIAISGMC